MDVMGCENQDAENAGKGGMPRSCGHEEVWVGGGEDDADQWELSWFLGSRMHDGMIVGWWK